MVAVASGRSNRAAIADPLYAWSSIIGFRVLGAVLRRSRTCGFSAGFTTISRRGENSETPGWTSSRIRRASGRTQTDLARPAMFRVIYKEARVGRTPLIGQIRGLN